jgi:hypothetical protein
MTTVQLGTVIGFILTMAGMFVVITAWFRIAADVNKSIPKEERIAPLSWYRTKAYRIWELHRSLRPDSKLRIAYYSGIALAICGFICIVCFNTPSASGAR